MADKSQQQIFTETLEPIKEFINQKSARLVLFNSEMVISV